MLSLLCQTPPQRSFVEIAVVSSSRISQSIKVEASAKTLSLHLYHYCQRIYQSIGSGYYQLTLAQIKQLAQQELQKYRQQIGLTSSVRFEAAGPSIKLSDLLNEFLSFKQKMGLVITSLLASI